MPSSPTPRRGSAPSSRSAGLVGRADSRRGRGPIAMPIAGFDQLHAEADAQAEPVPVAVAGGADATVLEALRSAADRGWVRPILAGPGAEIAPLAADLGIDLRGFSMVEADADATAAAAVAEVRAGRARLL